MTSSEQVQVSRPLWWFAWAVFIGAVAMLIWLWLTPLASTADLPGQTPLHDVSGR